MDDFLQVVCYEGSHRPETSYSNVNSLIGRERSNKFEIRKVGYDKSKELRNSKLEYDRRILEYKDKQVYECREGKRIDNCNYRYGREDFEKRIEYREFRFDYDKRTDSDAWPSFEKREYYETRFKNKPVDYILPDKQHLNRVALNFQSKLSKIERKDLCIERQSQLFHSKKDKSLNVNQNCSLIVNCEGKSHEIDIKRNDTSNGKPSDNRKHLNNEKKLNNGIHLNNEKHPFNHNYSLMVNHEFKSNGIDIKPKDYNNEKHSNNGIHSNNKKHLNYERDSNNGIHLNNEKHSNSTIHPSNEKHLTNERDSINGEHSNNEKHSNNDKHSNNGAHLKNERSSLHFQSKKDDCHKGKNLNNNRNDCKMLDYQLVLNKSENCSGNNLTNINKSSDCFDDGQGGNLKISDNEMEIDETINDESESGVKDNNGFKDEDKSDKSDDSCGDSEDEDPIINKNRLDHTRYVKGKKRGPKLKRMPEKMFPCQLCTYCSTRKHDLKRHFKRVHHNNPNHAPSLSEMDKKRKNRAIISDKDMTEDGKIKHSVIVRGQKRGPKMKHAYDKTYPCTLCTYAATRPFDLKRHISTVHRKEKPFPCEYCTFSAGLAETLKQHVLKMHNETKYKCNSCDFTCAKKLEYMRHLKDDHNYMPYSCESCDFSCIWNIELVQHRVKVHGK